MRVGFIGLGNIGMPMARRLVDAGHEVVGLDSDPARTRDLAGTGAVAAEAPLDLRECAVVCVAVPDDATTDAVVRESGLLAELEAGSSVLLHSTLLPPTAIRLAEAGRDHGVHVHDAPVSGGAARALSGELTLMVGGRADEQVAGVLEALGTAVPTGPVGSAAAVKLANQLSMLAALGALHEGLAIARHFGAGEETVLDVLRTSTGASWSAENWGFFDDLANTYDDAGVPVRYRPWSKDLWDVVASAREADLTVPIAAVLAQTMPGLVERRALAARGGGERS
ncbi:NAD(P)-dependent oxidoreductase [Georgenia alba]|uniref:NAD(P)-dependent oxidoreductase n=1 Tax=Georgenia alba TaxID=2233858 RepID=A0ABW2Q6B7_9MICO